jgi:hypothetical protein
MPQSGIFLGKWHKKVARLRGLLAVLAISALAAIRSAEMWPPEPENTLEKAGRCKNPRLILRIIEPRITNRKGGGLD